jgi:hypothetical protein
LPLTTHQLSISAEVPASEELSLKPDESVTRKPRFSCTGWLHASAPDDEPNISEADVRRWSRRASIASIAYTVLTAMIVGVSLFSLQLARDAVTQATRAAEAAEEQTKIALHAEQIQSRAYLFVNAVGVGSSGNKKDGHLIWGISPSITNSGNTPAISVKIFDGVQFVKDPNVIPKANFSDLSPESPSSTMAARDEHHGSNLAVSGDLLNIAKHKHEWIYLAVAIIYNDIFGTKHITQYCGSLLVSSEFDYDSSKMLSTFDPSSMESNSCPQYNCFDDGCTADLRYKLPSGIMRTFKN